MGGFSLRVALIVSATGRVFFRPREDLRRVGKRSTGGLALTVQDLRGPLAGSCTATLQLAVLQAPYL